MDFTPGVIAAMMILTIDNPLKRVFKTFPGCKRGFPPSATRLDSCSAIWRCCSRSAAFMTQFPDSTFAMVRKPSTTGSVIVGSGCINEVNVKKLSESNGVGLTESLLRTIVNPTNTGSCDSGGIIMEGNGLQWCSWKSSFRLAVNYTENCLLPKTVEQWMETYHFYWFFSVILLQRLLVSSHSCFLHVLKDAFCNKRFKFLNLWHHNFLCSLCPSFPLS